MDLPAKKSLLLCALVLALAGCSNKPPEPIVRAAPVTTPFDGLRAEEQRARDVQKVVDKQAEQQRKQVEAAQQ